MKKIRSKLPRRKRSNCSPILKLNPTSITTSSSNLTLEPSLACDSSTRLSTNNKSSNKRRLGFSFNNENDVVSEFRRITRSYSKRLEAIKAEKELQLSETTSSKDINHKGYAVNAVTELEISETTTRSDVVSVTSRPDFLETQSECSKPKDSKKNIIRKGFEVNAVNEFENSEATRSDVVSVTSRRDLFETHSECSKPKDSNSKSIIRKGFEVNAVSEIENSEATRSDVVSVTSRHDFAAVNEAVELEAQSEYSKAGEITSYVNNSVTNEAVNDDEAENCGESKLIADEFDLTCSEHLSGGDDECECDNSSVECTDVNMESSEVEYSSEFDTSSWYDSGSQFSERSFGDVNPSPTFQLFVNYRKLFCKSEFAVKVSSQYDDNQPNDRIIKLLRPEDEEHEESYQMLKKRERRQVYLHNYTEEYRMMKEYGNLVVQQRSKMVHWIMKQSANKELQKETLFLGVSLLDRFLSKGYFKNKRELEITGIACLTLATRIEENQPYNSIRQKFFYAGGNEYRRSEVVAMEWLVQEVLNFQCYLPTIYNFLWFYLKAARADQHVANTAKYLALQALLGHEQLCYWPSTVAASLVFLACLSENKQSAHQQITQIRNGSNDKDLSDCIKSMECLAQSIR